MYQGLSSIFEPGKEWSAYVVSFQGEKTMFKQHVWKFPESEETAPENSLLQYKTNPDISNNLLG